MQKYLNRKTLICRSKVLTGQKFTKYLKFFVKWASGLTKWFNKLEQFVEYVECSFVLPQVVEDNRLVIIDHTVVNILKTLTVVYVYMCLQQNVKQCMRKQKKYSAKLVVTLAAETLHKNYYCISFSSKFLNKAHKP